MKFISKKGSFPLRLTKWKYYHFKELYKLYIDPSISGSTVWKYLDNHRELNAYGTDEYTKDELRESLVNDQGHICCYCGQRIENDHRTIREHLNPKNIYKTRTYDYINLLASCSGGNYYKIHVILNNETLTSIASDYGVDEEYLIEVYVNLPTAEHIRKLSRLYDIENLKEGDKLIIIPKQSKNHQHCDTKKGKKEIPLTPIQNNIENLFSYLPDGKIDIRNNKELETTVNILGLNQNSYLIASRKEMVAAAKLKKTKIFNACKKNPILYKKSIDALCAKYYTKDAMGKFEPFIFILVSILKQ